MESSQLAQRQIGMCHPQPQHRQRLLGDRSTMGLVRQHDDRPLCELDSPHRSAITPAVIGRPQRHWLGRSWFGWRLGAGLSGCVTVGDRSTGRYGIRLDEPGEPIGIPPARCLGAARMAAAMLTVSRAPRQVAAHRIDQRRVCGSIKVDTAHSGAGDRRHAGVDTGELGDQGGQVRQLGRVEFLRQIRRPGDLGLNDDGRSRVTYAGREDVPAATDRRQCDAAGAKQRTARLFGVVQPAQTRDQNRGQPVVAVSRGRSWRSPSSGVSAAVHARLS